MMSRIPGVPTLDPVNKPSMSPQEAGRPGEAIAQVGEVSSDAALQQQGLDLYIKKAQEHVDTLAARNQMDAAYADIQNQLAKTQNSRDVAGVIEDGNKTLNAISARWSNSPASVTIQMDADSLRPSLSRVGTVRQVDLMGKELKINLNRQAETLAGDYASGNRDAALAAFTSAVDGGVKSGLLGDVEAGEYVRLFRQKGQELQIRNAITNASPEVNQKIYDEISQHRDQFPDVMQEQLDTYKGQALAAFEAHTKFQDWAEGQMALKTQLVPKIQQFTNPATGVFDESAAMADNAKRLTDGEITETQSKVLAQGFASHQAQLQIGMRQEANKRLDDIEKDLSNHNFADAAAKLEANQPWFENNGFADEYRAALHYTRTAESEVRSEAAAARAETRYEYQFGREVAQQESADTLGQVQHFISSGGVLTKADLQNLAGRGKGKMSTQDVDRAWKMMQDYENQPDFKSALNYANDSFAIPKNASADLAASQNRKYAQTVELFQQQVNAHPEKSKLEIMHEIVKGEDVQRIKDHADRMFGTGGTSSRLFGGIKDFLSLPFTYGLKPGDTGYKAPAAAPVASPPRPANVPEGYTFNAHGPKGAGWYAPAAK